MGYQLSSMDTFPIYCNFTFYKEYSLPVFCSVVEHINQCPLVMLSILYDCFEEFVRIYIFSEMKHREVLHYGYEFRYDINDVDADDPLLQSIPVECNEILQKALQTGYVKHLPDQLTVNKYVQGQGQ